MVWATGVLVAAKAPVVPTAPPPTKALAARTPFKSNSACPFFAVSACSSGWTAVDKRSNPKRVIKHWTHCFPDLYNFTRVFRELSSKPLFIVRLLIFFHSLFHPKTLSPIIFHSDSTVKQKVFAFPPNPSQPDYLSLSYPYLTIHLTLNIPPKHSYINMYRNCITRKMLIAFKILIEN